ncbi:histidinol-phosphate transaminase [Streptomyces sp. NPDC050504]|uniref:histidinol-phosphate transaminase n=1 Tax=Streptomyces sp. NPDC050504 TaxID=3365618 RepID=UPI0037880A43
MTPLPTPTPPAAPLPLPRLTSASAPVPRPPTAPVSPTGSGGPVPPGAPTGPDVLLPTGGTPPAAGFPQVHGLPPVGGLPPVDDLPPADELSRNENPFPPLPSVVEAVQAELYRFNRYPDPGCAQLVAALAERHSVPASHVVPGTGSAGVVQDLVAAVAGPGDEVLFAWRSYEAFPRIAWAAGASSVTVPLRAEAHDLDALADAVTERTRVVLVCNPNNPTGTVVRGPEMERFLDRVPPNVLVVVDEAYREFVRDPEVPDAVALHRARPNVAVLRTFSKAYGLAQLRVGYALAHPALAAAVRARCLPFAVSGLAQAAALASLRAERELAERIDSVVAERTRLVEGLRGAGLTVPDSQANFVWLRLGGGTAAFTDACAAAGIAVRAYPGEGVRVSVGTADANDRLLRVAADGGLLRAAAAS